ncbi:MAG: lamin tail domain-containing protein [Luteolibacter sp.]|uniref:lamin tail domain-containing protein n=1 Tax=Luteolibacter sp. TaxID=1962973 RepID=UPI003263047E
MTLSRLILISCLLCATARAGLLAHWKLDSSPADQVADFPAVWTGAPAYTSSVAAPNSTAAAIFGGTWLNAGTGINFERHQTFSATAWIKGGTQDSTIIGDMVQSEEFQGWELHVGTIENGGNANSVTVWLINDYPAIAIQVNATTPVLNNQWHHVAFTYDGSSTAAGVKIYIDGIQAATTTGIDTLGSSIANNAAAGLNIGTRMDGAVHNFTGAIDEVALFNHVLTGAEMTSVFQSGVESISYPQITTTAPLPGQSVTALVAADVTFSFPVSGVDAPDLLVNGVPATAVNAIDSKNYHFTFTAPPQGDVNFTWAAGHGITGLNGVPAQPAGWSCLFVPVLPAGQLMIAEFLTKNAGGQEDEDHDTPDWIELVNPGTASVNLAGWALTDDPSKPRRWVLPSLILSPGARKLVFASGKNRTVAAGTLHTDFKLADDGGYLALSDPSGNLVHVFDGYPNQEGNVSFGLLATGKPSDGRAGWRYLSPTPAAAQSTAYSGAAISSMNWSPAAPLAGNPITVTIRTSPEAVLTTPPVLYYRVMYGSDIPMNFADDGLHGDGAAGDLLWGAVIPSGATAGQMVRWRASLVSKSVTSRWPINSTGSLPLPVYEGTVIGGNTAGQALPVYQVFVSGYTFPVNTSQSGIDSTGGGRGAVFGYGKLYDNVLIRIKGTTSLNLFKRSHRIDFNPGRDFEWSPDHPAQRELNMNSEYNDPSYLRQNQQLWMHRDSGNAGTLHFPVRMLMNGVNWQLAFHSYSADSELIETMGLDPRGALYKQVGQLDTNAGGEKKTRKWETNADYTAFKAGIYSGATAATKSLYVFDNLNLPATINYLAVARLAQEADDVWANMVIYRDSDGTGEWRPIPFDLNLSFGQLFYGGSSANTVIHATDDANKSHPLYGSSTCLSNTGNIGQWNRLYDAIIQNPVTREMLLRRIRTLTDRYLSTTAATSSLETNFNTIGALIGPDADIDRTRWGWPPNSGAYGLGPNISPAQGLATLKTSFLAPRRTHFYTTHSINNLSKTLGTGNNNKAGIPDAQIASPVVTFGAVLAHPTGNQDQEYIQLNNPGTAAIDISDWTLRSSGGPFKFKGGTVIPAAGSIYISPNVVAFRNRTVSPKKNENRLVVGPYSGHLSQYGENLRLENATGGLVAQTTVAADPAAPAAHLAVTEILSNSAHTNSMINGDWWEITNTGSASLDLDGFSWDDNRNLPGQIIFPPFTLNAGESAIILDEDDDDEAAVFRSVWNLPVSVKILTRANFNQSSLRSLGDGDSVVVYLPNGTQTARSDYPEHVSGRSRAWFLNGLAVPGGYSQIGKYAAVSSTQVVADLGSPGFAAADPATFTAPYDIWSAANDLWSTAANPTGDPDGDGRTNRAEYIFGGNPRLADGAPAQSIMAASGNQDWTITRRSNDPSLVYILESSADLTHWSVITPTQIAEVPHPTLTGYVRTTYRIVRDDAVKFLRARAN